MPHMNNAFKKQCHVYIAELNYNAFMGKEYFSIINSMSFQVNNHFLHVDYKLHISV